MHIAPFPFETIDWTTVPAEFHPGDTGTATWQIRMMHDIRVRLVTYSADYEADHWCSKGHVIYCLEGEMITRLEDGREYHLQAGQCYIVGDKSDAHRTRTAGGCKLFIVD